MNSNAIEKALARGNFIRALSLAGYKTTLGEEKIDGHARFFIIVRSALGFEGRFDSGSEAWAALKA